MLVRKPVTAIITFALIFSFVFASLPTAASAQGPSAVATETRSYEKELATIEEKVEARRKELGIPGVSLVIVKDDQIIYLKGLGYKDFENKVAVTPDTQFAIGSATKAFTGLTVLMAKDEGKVSLDESPKKYLPYFKMYDPETDKNITVRDLMSHSSGLNRTDLAMMTGRLSRSELIQVAAQAKPTGRLREKFQYQNIMFTAAGEIVTQVEKTPWEKFVVDRVIKPLGMNNTTLSMKEMAKTPDHSFGYSYNPDDKETTKLPYRDIDQVAPAGSINSSARDMAQWLRFVMNGGTVDGKRLVSESSYAEWLRPQMRAGAAASYGFGWFLRDWHGFRVIEHGGNIDGFNSQVAMIPEKKLGFVLLTNVSASPLGAELMPIVWQNILGDEKIDESVRLPLVTLQRLVGKYRLDTNGGHVDVKLQGDSISMTIPGKGSFMLKRTAPRTFSLEGAPQGYGAEFLPGAGDATELALTTPEKTINLPRVNFDGTITKKPVDPPANLSSVKDLIGKYQSDNNGQTAEMTEVDGKITFQIPGQPAFTLIEKGKDKYGLSPLPDNYWLTVSRDAENKVQRVMIVQPEGEFGFKNVNYAGNGYGISAANLKHKVIEAIGGEAAIRKMTTRVSTFNVDFVHQGVKAHGTSWIKAPNKAATETIMTALGKTIMLDYDFFDGTAGRDISTLSTDYVYTGRKLADVKRSAQMYGGLDWTTDYKSVEISRIAKVGDEDCYAVLFTPKEGTKFTEYYSTKTFLLMKRDGVEPAAIGELPFSVTYSDYRVVEGMKMPFKTVTSSLSNGDVVTTVTSVKVNAPVDDKVFAPKKLKF